MNLFQRVEDWGNHHHPKWLDLIRIALGVFLCYKGIQFLQNTSGLIGMMQNRAPFGDFALLLLAHYVLFAHILGGILLTLGIFTRFACIIQIPVLLGAIIFVNTAKDQLRPYGGDELFLSILVLLLLIYFLIVGNGPWALKIVEDKNKHAHSVTPGDGR